MMSREYIVFVRLCSICFENRSKLDAFTVTACDCKHVYCLPCMSSYATILVDDGVVDHYCPGVAECHALLTAEELRVLLFPEAFAKYGTFLYDVASLISIAFNADWND